MQTKNHGWFDAGPFNQKPSIKTAPAQCPAAATGFIKLMLGLCAMQELPSRQATPNQRWPNVGSPSTTLDQRHTKIDLTCRVRRAPHMKISRADPPAKLRPRPKAASLLGHRLGFRPNNKTTSVRCPHPPGQCRHQQAKTLSQCRPKAGPSSTTMTPNNAPAQAQSLPSKTRKRPANVGTMLSQRLRRWPNTAVTPAARLASAGLCLHGAYKCCYTLKVKWRTLNHNTKTKAGQCLTVDKTHKRKMLTHLTIYLPGLIIYEQAQQIKAQFWSWKMMNKS